MVAQDGLAAFLEAQQIIDYHSLQILLLYLALIKLHPKAFSEFFLHYLLKEFKLRLEVLRM